MKACLDLRKANCLVIMGQWHLDKVAAVVRVTLLNAYSERSHRFVPAQFSPLPNGDAKHSKSRRCKRIHLDFVPFPVAYYSAGLRL
jgi:hypothetical protein